MFLFLIGVLIVARTCQAAVWASEHRYYVKESVLVPQSWTRIDKSPPGRIVNLRINLQESNFDELEQILYQASDPTHARYGQHLQGHEALELAKPTIEAVDSVRSWLNAEGIETCRLEYGPAMSWISVSLPIHEIEALLHTNYSTFVHQDGTRLDRTPEYYLPSHLHEHISTIQPTTCFLRHRNKANAFKTRSIPSLPQKRTMGHGPVKHPLCDPTSVTPACLRSFYGTDNYTAQAAEKNKMAITNFLGAFANRSDDTIYLQKFRPEAVAGASTFQVVSIANGTTAQTPTDDSFIEQILGFEAALDSQTILGMGWPTPLTIYSTGGTNPDFIPEGNETDFDEPYVVWLQYVLSLPDEDLPTVISMSYNDDEQTVSTEYAMQACKLFAQLGARGVTVFACSGDFGVGLSETCISNEGQNATTFLPQFPASCPYVTAVGGTKNFDPEVAAFEPNATTFDGVQLYTSGAGFSNIFAQPSYQQYAVNAYLAANNSFPEYAGLFNQSGRAYPDMAASSQHFSFVYNATVSDTQGTSASTPLVAGIFALVNDALLAAGRPPMGFLNPWLYGGGYKAFNDILTGSSVGCNTTGFPAAPGWDAVTGFGSPNFWNILNYLNVTTGSTW